MGCRRRTQPSCLGSAPSAQITACWGRWQTQRSVGRLGLFLHPSGAMRAACRALPRLPRLPAAVKSPGTASACAEAVALPTSATAARGAAFSAAAGRGAGPGWLGAKFRWAGMAAGLGLGAAGAAQLYSSGGSRGPAECEAGPGAGSTGDASSGQQRKTRIVVLGSGWGAISFLKQLDPASYGRE